MSGQGGAQRKPDRSATPPPDASPSQSERVDRETDVLRDAVSEMRAAMFKEGIDENGTLGVWCKALQSALIALAVLVEMQTRRIEDRAEAMTRASKADEDRHSKLIAETQLAIRRSEAQTKQSEEHRQSMATQLASALYGKIEQKLNDSVIVRQVQWNRRRNWSSAALVATIMLGVFIGGAVWDGARSDRELFDRCLKQLAHDAKGQAYCPLDIVRGAL